MKTKPSYLFTKAAGWSLIQLLMLIVIISVLSTIAVLLHQKWMKHVHLYEAYSALLTNAHALEYHYQRKGSYQTAKQQWPVLPIQQTTHFCLRAQGDPRYAHSSHYTLKAVAVDPDNEPRILKINQHGTVLICAGSKSRCDQAPFFFKGGGDIDQQCRPFHA